MKKILVLTSRFPYPVVGGDRLRIHQLCKKLSENYDLTLISLCEKKSELYLVPSDDVFSRIERIYLPKWRSYLNTLFAIFSNVPLQVAYYKSREISRRIELLGKDYDAILAHLIRTADFVKNMPVVKFLEMTDSISMNYERFRKIPLSFLDFRQFVYLYEIKRLKKYEKKIVNFFDHTFLVSDVDVRYLFGNDALTGNVSVISNGVDLAGLEYCFDGTNENICFIGNLKSFQNFDAALYFAKEVLPLIQKEKRNIVFYVVGRIDSKKAEILSRYNGVRVVGEVESISASVRDCAVGVCPVRLGAGIQNKILEYMALGMPVVTSSVGLEGIKAIPGSDLLVADTPADMSLAIISLLGDREKAQKMAINARKYVEMHHNWSKSLFKLEEIFEKNLESSL